jgi:Mg-chelatase subunit ChlD
VRRIIVLSFLILPALAARAEAGLDLILLVDRSSSMIQHRHLAPLFLSMAVELLARNAAANRVDHRAAVVGFGSAARIDIGFASCSGEPAELRRRINALPATNLGETNVLAALTAAKRLFDSRPGDPVRRQSIVLLTDGGMFVRGADMRAYRDSMQRFAASNFTAGGITLDVLLLDDHYRAFWTRLATVLSVTARDPAVFLAQSHHAIAQRIGTRTVEPGARPTESLVVPPYLETIVFDVFRGSPDAQVEIFPPASTLPIRDGRDAVEAVRVGSVLTTYVVPRPRAGRWRIRRSHGTAHVRIVSQQFFPRGLLVQPGPTEPLRQYDRVSLIYRVLDAEGQPLREISAYRLVLEVALASPDGQRTSIRMRRAATLGPSVFRSEHDSECALPGRYWTDVKVMTVDDAGSRLDVFHDRWSGFSVSPAQRVDCRVRASGTIAWLPLKTEVSCFDAAARVADLQAITTDSKASLFRALLWRDGRAADAALDLRSAGPGKLRGTVHGASRSGSYRLQLIADRAHLRPAYNIRFVPTEVTFMRKSVFEWLLAVIALAAVIALVRRRRSRA